MKKYNDVDDNDSIAEINKKEEVIIRKDVVNEELVTEIELRKAFEQSTQHGNSEEADITYVLTWFLIF